MRVHIFSFNDVDLSPILVGRNFVFVTRGFFSHLELKNNKTSNFALFSNLYPGSSLMKLIEAMCGKENSQSTTNFGKKVKYTQTKMK